MKLIVQYIQIFVFFKIKIKTIGKFVFSFYFSEDVNPVNKFLFVLFFQNQNKPSTKNLIFFFQKKVGTNLSELCSQARVKLCKKDFSKVYKGGVRHCSSDWNSCQKTPLKNEGLILS